MNIEPTSHELTERELHAVCGGKHPAKVTTPEIKLGLAYADHQPWGNMLMSLFF